MKCFNIRFRKFGRGARGRVDCESCRSCQPRLLKIALVYVLLGWTAESPAAAHVALTGCPALLRTLVFAASLAFTCTLCVRRRLAGFQNEFGVHFNFAGIPGRDHAPGLCTLRDLSALQPAMDLASWLALVRSRSPHSTTPMARLVSSGRLSPYFRLCWFCHGLRNSGAKAVRSHLQAVPARHTGRCQGLPFSVDCHCLSPLRGAAPIPALRGSSGAAKSSGRKTSADWGTLTCLGQAFADHTHHPL